MQHVKIVSNNSYIDRLANGRDEMIIEIEGYDFQAILFGKKCSEHELKQMYIAALRNVTNRNQLPRKFCSLYGFDEVMYDSEIEVDFVIDTDTDRIYSPQY